MAGMEHTEPAEGVVSDDLLITPDALRNAMRSPDCLCQDCSLHRRAALTIERWQAKAEELVDAARGADNTKNALARALETLERSEARRHQLAVERDKALSDLLRERQRLTVLRHDHPRGLLIDRIFDHPALEKVLLAVRPGYITLSTENRNVSDHGSYAITSGINERGFLDLIEALDALLPRVLPVQAASGWTYQRTPKGIMQLGASRTQLLDGPEDDRIPPVDLPVVTLMYKEPTDG